ncbi:hypothetical protein EJ03DRAFT_354107 [Teratosphaeria nubilosa]|uniref:Nucleoporin NUP49/NSP49 n=1 Tax=Teratosphaeria nubilosa TaxID=161662 RepID=A0A6G1L028_9PEZI|nr:hypothetical protein EJ03DRAFT_354107 [Teratosphaeria nubilosa]
MAFGRSNSLSLNTGQTNSLFAQQQNQSQPPAGPSLFGNTTTSQPGGGGLFGNSTATTQPAPSGGLFGSSTATGGLFGNTTTNTNPGGGLFSNTASNQTANTTGGLFSNPATNQSRPGGLFGSSTTNMPATGSSLFGGSTTAPANQQNNTGGSLFGNSTSTGLFGGKTAPDPKASWGGNMFHQANEARNNPPPAQSAFGVHAYPAQTIPSLLPSAQYRQSQMPANFMPRLSMGQGNAPQPTTTVGAVNVGVNDLRGTTRFQDLQDDLRKEFEALDEMIKKQEKYALDVQNFMNSSHPQNVASIEPDVELIKDKTDNVENVLIQDAHLTEARKHLAEHDWDDFQRCQRVIENLKLPPGYQVPSAALAPTFGNASRLARPATSTDTSTEETYDTDLINNYFTPLATDLSKQLSTYDANLSEIEAHMKVIEQSAVHQAQQLAAKRAGISGTVKQEDTVQELSQTLIGFEQSILGVAAAVGECRAGVDELVLGRLGGIVGVGGGGGRY